MSKEVKEVTAKVETISPETAWKWLANNSHNRNLSQMNVRKIMKEINEDNWELNGQTICFDWNGRLVDGQHRLQAIHGAGKTVESIVVRGLDPAIFHTIDTGRTRNASDVLHIKGETSTAHLASALRVLFFYDKFKGDMSKAGTHQKHGMSIMELEKTLEAHPDLRKCVNEVAHLNSTKMVQPSVALTTFYLFSRHNHKAAVEFIDKLSTGYELAKDSALLTLRNKLLEIKRNRTYNSQLHSMAIIILSWNAFLRDEKLPKLEWDRTEPFPVVEGKRIKSHAA